MPHRLSDTVCPSELLRRNLVEGEQRIATAQHNLGQPTVAPLRVDQCPAWQQAPKVEREYFCPAQH
jgi:hypothetical protein